MQDSTSLPEAPAQSSALPIRPGILIPDCQLSSNIMDGLYRQHFHTLSRPGTPLSVRLERKGLIGSMTRPWRLLELRYRNEAYAQMAAHAGPTRIPRAPPRPAPIASGPYQAAVAARRLAEQAYAAEHGDWGLSDVVPWSVLPGDVAQVAISAICACQRAASCHMSLLLCACVAITWYFCRAGLHA